MRGRRRRRWVVGGGERVGGGMAVDAKTETQTLPHRPPAVGVSRRSRAPALKNQACPRPVALSHSLSHTHITLAQLPSASPRIHANAPQQAASNNARTRACAAHHPLSLLLRITRATTFSTPARARTLSPRAPTSKPRRAPIAPASRSRSCVRSGPLRAIAARVSKERAGREREEGLCRNGGVGAERNEPQHQPTPLSSSSSRQPWRRTTRPCC